MCDTGADQSQDVQIGVASYTIGCGTDLGAVWSNVQVNLLSSSMLLCLYAKFDLVSQPASCCANCMHKSKPVTAILKAAQSNPQILSPVQISLTDIKDSND